MRKRLCRCVLVIPVNRLPIRLQIVEKIDPFENREVEFPSYANEISLYFIKEYLERLINFYLSVFNRTYLSDYLESHG